MRALYSWVFSLLNFKLWFKLIFPNKNILYCYMIYLDMFGLYGCDRPLCSHQQLGKLLSLPELVNSTSICEHVMKVDFEDRKY